MNKIVYELVIGIEVHLELNTKTKMFSSAPNDFNLPPNTGVSVIDLGYPGTLPAVNKMAVIKALKLAKAMQMRVEPELRFDRKHYFYYDLPKGFQITQQNYPIATKGVLPTPLGEVAVQRFHLEEDTAQSVRIDRALLLNYNRAGVPLIEIVTDPVIYSSESALAYLRSLRELALALDISDARLEEGSMRADINLSLRPQGTKAFGTKVEIKNLNSFQNIKLGIEYEIGVQTATLNAGKKVVQATKRFDEKTLTTQIMREKTEAIDYRYIPEPNIVPLTITPDLFAAATLPELPWARRARYSELGVETQYIEQLLDDPRKYHYFDQVEFADKKMLARIFFSEVTQLANAENKPVDELGIKPKDLSDSLTHVVAGTISQKQLKTLIPLLQNNKLSLAKLLISNNLVQQSDGEALGLLVAKILKENMQFIEANKDRLERVTKFVIGLVMKETKGQANPVLTAELVAKALASNE